MKHLVLACALALPFLAMAQPPATRSMVEAEKQFAATSVEKGTRDAFLAFLDSNAVMFDRDSFTNGMQLWLKREQRPGILDWKPVVSELAGSGDWGFTTGPWTFRNKKGDTAATRGHFFTIWKKTGGDSWKFIFDCGAEGGNEPLEALYSFQAPRKPGTVAALMMTERAFAARLQENALQAHQQYLSVTSVLVRNGQPVAITPGQQGKWFRGLPATITSVHSGMLMAPSNDLALVYGTVVVNGKAEPYLRLWRSEPAGWKLAAELLRL